MTADGTREPVTERAGSDLRGPVQRCRLQRTWYPGPRHGERSDTTILEFRPEGSLVSRWYQDPRGSESTTVYDHDAAGRRVAMRAEHAGEVFGSERYEYDGTGRLARVVAQRQDGTDRVTETHEYDAGGRRKIAYVDTRCGPDVMQSFGVEGAEVWYSAPGAATVTTVYNADDRPTELIFRDGTGNALSRVDFLYDEAGCLREESHLRFADVLPAEVLTDMAPGQLEAVRALFGVGGSPERRLYRNDAHGRKVETSQIGPFGRESATMAYNDQGDEIQRISESDHRELSVDEHGQVAESAGQEGVNRSETRFLYEYDAHGNWIRKVVEVRSRPDQEFSCSSIEQRTLTYYS